MNFIIMLLSFIIFFLTGYCSCFFKINKYIRNKENIVTKKIIKIPIQKIVFLNQNKTIEIYKYKEKNKYLVRYDFDKNFNNSVDFEFNNKDIVFLNDVTKINELIFFLNNNILNKKLIQITPGGILGYYDTGICKIIKERYNLDNYIFNGASAGSWNSLIMTLKTKNINNIITKLINLNLNNIISIKNLQLLLKDKILKSFSTTDFNLNKLFISVSVIENMKIINYVYTDFRNLEDALDCCIASSNIPFFTGDLIYKYNNKISFDGGFISNPYLFIMLPKLQITNSLWNKNNLYRSLLVTNKTIENLYNDGLIDTFKNINFIDNIFKL